MMSTPHEQFPRTRSRERKRHAGPGKEVGQTPLAIRTRMGKLSAPGEAHVRSKLTRALGKFADRIERLTVRFEDLNGPRGGVDVACRVKVVLTGLPSVLVEERAETDLLALARAAKVVARSVRKSQERKSQERAGRSRGSARIRSSAAKVRSRDVRESEPDPGSWIGRRVGRGVANLRAALERPEKHRRDVPVNTAEPGVSATDRKAGGNATARRNTRARAPRATATLEDSRQARPSRKPTRRSANRTKSGTQLEKRTVAKATSASTRALQARSRRGQS